MEALAINPVDMSQPWREFPAKLPVSLCQHQTVLYNDKLIMIGGMDEEDECVNSLYEVQLVPPYKTKLLGRMTQGRAWHSAQMMKDEIFICGGAKSISTDDITDDVLLFNVVTNKCRQGRASLPHQVCNMTSVLWGRNVVLLGGLGPDGECLSSVLMYCTENGKGYYLPDMKCKRDGCSAVVVDDYIIVMGGRDEDMNVLNSVECFDFRRYVWEDLPPMKEGRSRATAVAW